MEAEKKRTKNLRAVFGLLLAGSFLAAIKCIFVSLQMDEEYAISMPYRMLLGDKMFSQIWDPHQTSAFLMEFLIWVYLKIFHTTTGVVIWVRIWGTLIHAGISYGVYRVLQQYLSKEYSFYLGILYFNLLPKGYIMPEFSNMLVWSLTLLLLSLFRLEKTRSPWRALESGLWMCLMTLSYPSAVLIFPFLLIYLWKQEAYGRKSAGIVAGTCLAAGGAYLAYLFRYMTPAELIENMRYLMIGHSGHTGVGVGGKLWIYVQDAGILLLIVSCYAIVAWLILQVLKRSRRTKAWFAGQDVLSRRVLYLYLVLFTAVLWQAVHWLLMLWRYEMSYIYAVYFVVFGVAVGVGRQLESGMRRTVRLWMESGALMFLAVLILTNLTMFTTVRYVLPVVVMGLAAFIAYSGKAAPQVCGKLARALLVCWCFTAIFVKGWEYRDSEGEMKNITRVRGIVSVGPAKGVFTEYMLSYMQESTYAEMQQYVQPKARLMILDMGSIGYLFQDVSVASYTTICDPRYNDVLLKYWERDPDKYPDVIMVPCWYGELRWDPESWIMRWIEEEYDADQVVDGKYFRYFIRKND